MYIETRTTAQEVLDDVSRELRAVANATLNQAIQRQRTPSMISKTALREQSQLLKGALALAIRLFGGIDQIPATTHDLVNDAFAQAQKALAA